MLADVMGDEIVDGIEDTGIRAGLITSPSRGG
jgi:predicted metal-dependent phosphotriesterase family hydrolase